MLIETAHGHVFDHACPQWADRTLGGIGGHQGVLSRAEGCWTFDARDRTPRPSRATAHHPNKCTDRELRSPPAIAGSFYGATSPLTRTLGSTGHAPERTPADRQLHLNAVRPDGDG